jgi:hypothetical protein
MDDYTLDERNRDALDSYDRAAENGPDNGPDEWPPDDEPEPDFFDRFVDPASGGNDWPEPDGYRLDGGYWVPTSR